MAYRIAPQASQPVVKAVKREPYLQWVRQLPCIVTGQHGVEACHLSTANLTYGHFGRGKSQKASDRWALPLTPAEHRRQHAMNELIYWRSVRVNSHLAALVLWGMYSDNATPDEAASIIANMRFGISENASTATV
jgi:hypothetical protein